MMRQATIGMRQAVMALMTLGGGATAQAQMTVYSDEEDYTYCLLYTSPSPRDRG